ncbi:MAG: hypothetical protein ACXWUD_07680 [Methylosarcina sp.]
MVVPLAMADDDDHLLRYAAHLELETRMHALRCYGGAAREISVKILYAADSYSASRGIRFSSTVNR